ncbi:C2 calcium-dependent membrane-targeting protein [Tanacetum coccineum]
MSRVDDAVQRILRAKFTRGLLENPLADYNMAKYLGCQEHRDLAREAEENTCCGGWTIKWQGLSENSTPIMDYSLKVLNPKPNKSQGSLENPLARLQDMAKYWEEHRDLAREAVRKALVLLNNGKYSQPLLPLPKKTSKILVAGSHADNIGYQVVGG